MGLSLKLNGKDTKNESKKKDADKKEPKRYTVSFSLAGLVSLTVLTLVALSWIFILGVLVGRGYKPESAVPELEHIMPKAQQAPAQNDDVLRAEDLNFYSELSKKPGADASTGKSATTQQQAKKPAPVPTPKPKVTPQPEPQVSAPAPAKTAKPVAPSEPMYRYAYQVASLKDIAAARKFQDKLASLGLSSRLERAQAKGSTWHRVIISFQGTADDTRDLMRKLGTLGISKPLLKSKTPL